MTKIKKGFKLCEVADEFIIVAHGLDNVNFSKVISLNEIAAFLWNKAIELEDFNADTLAAFVLEDYEIDEETALKDSQTFITQLITEGLAE